ncbi:hypothetical protein [Altericroceibacterium xinjiangense]|uniref:hypothetical protein n=1 Tax=Altericroceibacterium xinjiangense TaxID=762261 RepID=UPI000F7DC6B4|nr:hypothetical protein [Altericroceibacterium xinjiangense]
MDVKLRDCGGMLKQPVLRAAAEWQVPVRNTAKPQIGFQVSLARPSMAARGWFGDGLLSDG